MTIRLFMCSILCLLSLTACSGSSDGVQPPSPGPSAPRLSALDPMPNNPSVLRGALVTVTFDKPMNTASSGSFAVYGSMSGLRAGVYAGGGTATLTFNANSAFGTGESVEVILTGALTSEDGRALAFPFVYRFQAESFPGNLIFAPLDTVAGQIGVLSLKAGDFDNDGDMDLATAGVDGVHILVNDGSGSFADLPSPVLIEIGLRDIAAGDWDGDGDLDLAAANFGSDNVTILQNNPTGIFTPAPAPISFQTGASALEIGDWDGDGDIDLAVANQKTANSVRILLNDGSGNYTDSGLPVINQFTVSALASGDFDGDGDLDLAAANQAVNSVRILLNDGSGNYTDSGLPVINQFTVSDLASGDFDGDGDLDLAAANPGTLSGGSVVLLINNGGGSFSQTFEIGGQLGVIELATGDWDGDGDPDLAAANQTADSVRLLINDGSGGFTLGPLIAGQNNASALTTGDFDGDDDLDLAVADQILSVINFLAN